MKSLIKKLGRSIPLGYRTLDIRTLLQKSQGERLFQWIPLDGCRTGEILLATKFFPTANITKEPESKKKQHTAKHQAVETPKTDA